MGRGYTLVELITAMAIAAVALHAAAPAMSDFLARQRAIAVVNAVITTTQLARTSAIMHRQRVTFCSVDPANTERCGGRGDWHHGALIFADANRNRRHEATEALYGGMPALRRGESLIWRSFRNRSYLQFLPTGLTPWQNGHFQYCPADSDDRFARQLILNAQGRVRVARDLNGDGIVEDAQRRPLSCL